MSSCPQREPQAAGPPSFGTAAPRRIVLIFVDGVGIGEDDPGINPWLSAHMPCMRALLGGVPTQATPSRFGARAGMVPVDATLDMDGLPQSGTGQTALLSGVNTARIFGRHFGPWVPTLVRPMLAAENLLSRAIGAGRTARFANAYHAREPGRRPAAPTLAAHAAGLLAAGEEALREGRAVASSITNEMWQRHAGPAIPTISPEGAGHTLGRLAAEVDLTLFAHYDTDVVGHRGDRSAAVAALEKLDAFLGGVLDVLSNDTLLVMTSDHGNLEDTRGGHTRNPVPVVAIGPGHEILARRVHAITDVAPTLLALLGVA